MNKSDELKILAQAAAKLGPGSYLGPALTHLIPWVEQEIRSDIEPDLLTTLRGFQQERASLAAELEILRENRRELANDNSALERHAEYLRSQIDGKKKILVEMSERLAIIARS